MIPTKLMGSDKDLKVLENSATVFNLALVVLSLLIVLVRKIAVYTWHNRVSKEEADEIGSRVSAVETQFLNVEIGKVYKASVCCCFYVLLLQAVVLCYDGVCLITKSAQGEKGVSLEPLFLPASQFFAWFVLSFSTLSCKVKTLERLPLLIRVWWVTSFMISLLTLYLDGKEFAIEGLEHLKNSHLLANLAATPALGFLFLLGLRGATGIHIIRGSGLQEPLLVEEDAGCLKVTPYSEAGIFSLATLSWLNNLLSIGVKRPLELRDIPLLAPEDRSKFNYKILNINWERLKAENQASLAWALLRSFWKEAAKNAIFAGLYTLVSYVGPYMISDFVDYLGGIEHYPHEGYILAGVFFVAKLIETLTTRQWYLGVDILGMHVRSALTAMVYRKGLRLSSSARQSHTSGEIVNYMAVDVQRVGDYAWYLHDIWMLPLQIILALAILYKSVGIACIATLIATILSIVITIPLAQVQELYQDKLMAAKDDRMRKTSECLRNMRILKSQAWEDRYKVRLEEMRSVEFKWLKKALYSQAFITFFFWSSPIFVAAVTFGTSILIGGQLTAGGVLSALATFRILQEPLRNFPDLVSMMAQTKVSLDRITGFLQEEELQEDATIVLQRGMSNVAIEIKDGEFQWDSSSPRPTLSGIQMKVERGMRVAVCGSVGSGKSSFLSCILGEIPKTSGEVRICGSAAYVSQSAWIQSGNIEENVLFGNPLDKAKYKRVLHACSLKKDLELFSHGDQTIIGDRGINLSGGQKQRVQLARALYQDADIYLLDDPFSAVDAHTGSELFKEYILTALATKTVVFVTHQIEFLPAADLILVLKEGQIIQAGKYDELLQAGTDFNTLVSAHQEAIEAMDIYNHSDDESDDNHGLIKNCESAVSSIDTTTMVPNESMSASDKKAIKEKKKAKRSRKKQLVQEEERERGKISMKIYLSYMAAAYKGLLIPLIIIAQTLFQVLQIASNWWMAWANPQTEGDTARVSNLVLIAVYMALAFGSSWFIFVRAVLVATFGLAAAQKLFMKMLTNVFRAPMSFFDSTPAGRILNRVSVDQSVVDLDIPFRLGGFASTTIQLLGIVGVMTQVTWQVLLLIVPMAIACLWMQKYYMASSRELVRIVSIQKSPIINLFGESIAGAATIRGFGQEKRFMKRNLYLLDCFARRDTIDGLCSSSGLVELLASEYWNIRTEINQWNDYPASYSYSVLRSVLCSYISQKEYLMEWILVNSPFYGVVIDVFMRDHILLLFRLCLKAIAREAAGYLVSISKGDPKDGKFCFQCPVMSRVLTWLASQLAILYGEVNGKVFAISMLKQSLLISASKSLFLFGEQRASKSVNVSKIDGKAVMEHDGRTPWIILVSQVAAAVAALHERFFFETRIRTIRASRFVPVYQRVQEHGYISKMADEERGKRSNYRAIIEHDGVLWHHGGNQDGNKNKSREELLAEERDYKRRRVSYRGKKMKRSTTQVMRDIIDEYMEEIKHAYMAGSGQSSLDSTKLASKASSMNDLDNEAKISKKAVPQSNRKEKDSVSDISMKSSRFGDEIKEKSNRNRDQEYHTSKSRSHDHRKQDEYKHSRKYQKRNEFEDRYDPSKSHDMNHDDL